jgi:hemerythrin-like domain-containing protein
MLNAWQALLGDTGIESQERSHRIKATHDLRMEHDAVRLTLKVLGRMAQEIERQSSLDNPQHVDQLLEFFTVFVDKCHHGKEEELLFPAMEQVGVGKDRGPIGVMLREHELGRECVRKMKTAFSRLTSGDFQAATDFARSARDYISLLNQHIEKENNVLFPMAERQLSEVTLAELSKGFDRIEEQKIGIGKHEEFHKMIDQLESAYLK